MAKKKKMESEEVAQALSEVSDNLESWPDASVASAAPSRDTSADKEAIKSHPKFDKFKKGNK